MLRTLLIGLIVAGCSAAASIPEGVSLAQWVREDLFAGYMADSLPDFERGVAKLEEVLAEQPDNGGALVWMASADIYRGILALESGDRGRYAELLASAKDHMERALETEPVYRVSVLATIGGMSVILGDRLAPEDRSDLWRRGRASYLELMEMQREMFDKMPPHFRGELLGGLAQLEQRLGEREKALDYARETVVKMAGTPYEGPAKAFVADPDGVEAPRMGCQTCHERNRLANVLARVKAR